MTIAVGVMCDNGIVLGCNLQHSTDIIKTAGQKMFYLSTPPDYNVLLTGAGSSDAIKKVVRVIGDQVSSEFPLGVTPKLKEIQNSIEVALATVYSDYIDVAQPEQRSALDFTLLVAVRSSTELGLFRTNRNMLVPENTYTCVGIGMYFGHYALTTMLGWHPSVELGSQVVAHVIAQAKEYMEGVGKGSDIHKLHLDGRHDSLLAPDRRDVEILFEEFY